MIEELQISDVCMHVCHELSPRLTIGDFLHPRKVFGCMSSRSRPRLLHGVIHAERRSFVLGGVIVRYRLVLEGAFVVRRGRRALHAGEYNERETERQRREETVVEVEVEEVVDKG